jgi:sugar lactone lactonase YvrE
LKTYDLLADMPNRCAFGGPDMATLYVTTATGELLAGKAAG